MSKNRTAQQNDTLRIFKNEFDRITLVEKWLKTPGINADLASGTEATRVPRNRDFEVLGTNGTSALATFSDGGGLTITTAGASADQMIILPHLDTKQSAWSAIKWNTNDSVAYGNKIKTGASIADTTIWVGLKLTNTSVTATDDDQVFFRYEPSTNSGKWQFIYSVGGTDYSLDTGVTVAASTSYELEIAIDSDRVPRGYVNGDHTNTGTAMTADIDLIPYFGVQADAAAAKAITSRGCAISKEQND